MVGVCAGIGQFEDNTTETHIHAPDLSAVLFYRQSYFIGLNFRLGVDYNITNRLSTGLAFSTHMYDALSPLRTWYGLQVSAGYRFPAKTVRFKPLEKNPLYHRWKVGWTYTCALTGNKGEIGFPYDMHNWQPSFDTDEKETARISHQPAIEMISPAVIRNRLAFRLRLGLDRYYYTGSAQSCWIDLVHTPPVYYYNRDRTEYYSKDYFITFSLLPQFNITRGKRYTLYALAGPSIGRILKEDLFRNTDQWFREVKFWAPFGYTGAGATFSIKGKLFLDTQLMFTLQFTTTPDNRRFVSSGLKVGVYL